MARVDDGPRDRVRRRGPLAARPRHALRRGQRDTAMRSIRWGSEGRGARSIGINRSRLTLAGTFERGRDRLGHGCQLAGGEADEGHAGAIGVARAARAVAVAVERRPIAALQAVVLADDPFLHAGLSSLDAVRAAGSRSRTLDTGRTRSPRLICAGFRTK